MDGPTISFSTSISGVRRAGRRSWRESAPNARQPAIYSAMGTTITSRSSMSLATETHGNTTHQAAACVAKVAILCRDQCPTAIGTIEHFAAQGQALALVVVESAV